MKFKLMKIVGCKTQEVGELENVARCDISAVGENYHFWLVEFDDGELEAYPVDEYLLVPMMSMM
jgi:hypothetical protein